jgi:VCBS repeat-containing protein
MKRDYSSRIAAVIAWYLCLFLSDAYADLIINSTETFALNPANSEVISIDGDLIIENGGTLQGASNTEIRLNGDWDNSANGSFIHGNTKVFFTGSGISVIKGNNQFHHLVINKKDAASGQEFTGSEIQIESGTTQTISSQLILNGATVDDRLKIRSTTNGVSHTLNASGAAYVEAWFLDVDDSTFIGNIDIPMNIDSSSIAAPVVGSGNNGDWVPNIPPVATALSMTAIEQTETGGITLTGTNFDGAVPTVFKITKLPVNGVLKDNATVIQSGSLPYTIVGTLTYTSTSDSALIDSFTFKANDGELDSEVPATVSIAINPVNDAPIISGTPDATVAEDTAYSFTPIATDVDIGYAHTFIINDKRPLWANFEPKTGALTGTPDNSAVGSYEDIVISVTDGIDRVALDPFTLTVTNTNDAPEGEVTISGIVGNNQILTASNNLSDVDGLGAITYRWLADGVDIAGANQGTYLLTQADVNKTITVVASYTDAQGMQEFVPSSNTTTQILESALSQLAADIKNNTSAYYEAAGITDVSETNLNSINNALDTVGVSTQIQVQKLVNSYNVILDFTENDLPGAIPPTVEDYSNIGVIGITQNSIILGLLSDVIELGDGVDVDSISKLQTITDAVLALNDQAENAANTLSKSQLEILGVEAVTDDNLSDIRLIIAETSEQLDQVAVIQLLVDRVVASHIIQGYSADSINHPAPTLVDYANIGLTNIVFGNIEQINIAIATLDASAIDSIDKIIALLTTDTDVDGVEDIIDSFPLDASETFDGDNDMVGNNTDNCPSVANVSQADFDSDSLGDACDQDEDNDGVVSADDAFRFNANYSLDVDNDGMPDAFENQYGFDVNNSLDRSTDSDGDGVTNIDEFLAGTNPRVNPNPGLPQLVIPDDIEVVSTGRMTAVDIGVANAIDGSQTVLQPVASFTGPFGAGRHEIVWSATDALGNQSKAVQVIKILPLVNLTPSSLIAEGGRVEISAVMSGDAADYPVRIPYEISGSAENTVDYQIEGTIGFIAIEEGRAASFSIEIKVDDELENDETIEVQIYQPTNAVLGSVPRRTISIIDGNLPPKISVIVEQGDNLGRVIAANKGEVTITAEVSDPNPEDSHSFDWQLESEQTSAVVSETIQDHKKVLVIDPSQLKPGVFSIAAKATDSADIVATTEVKTDFRLMEAAPDLSTEMDSDGDGVSDADEGYDDSDNDGIVDYMDNIVESNLAPINEDSSNLLQAPAGTQLILGEMAFANSKNTVLVSKQQVIDIISKRQLKLSEGVYDKDYDYPIGLYDFTITGAIPGRSYYLVIPLPSAIKEGQIFRKYMGSKIGWQNFVENAENILFSAQAVNGACPEPASRLYDYRLQVGNNCMQIYIEDGGPNDADGKTDGIVTDPAGIAIFNGSVEGSTVSPAGAPSSMLSSIKLSRSKLFVKGDTVTINIVALNNAGKYLDAVDIRVKCIFCLGVSVSPFTQTKLGVYEATITSGRQISFGYIEAELTNEFGSAKLAPQKLNVIYRPSGGCTIVANGRSDISLFLMLILLTLYHRRKKPLI